MSKLWKTKSQLELLEAFICLKNKNEAIKFFTDLLTESEIQEFASRFQAAKMLSQKVPYTEIEKQTGLSSTTIARIAKWLKKGKGGYGLVLKRSKK